MALGFVRQVLQLTPQYPHLASVHRFLEAEVASDAQPPPSEIYGVDSRQKGADPQQAPGHHQPVLEQQQQQEERDEEEEKQDIQSCQKPSGIPALGVNNSTTGSPTSSCAQQPVDSHAACSSSSSSSSAVSGKAIGGVTSNSTPTMSSNLEGCATGSQQEQKLCAQCGKHFATLKRCAGCGEVGQLWVIAVGLAFVLWYCMTPSHAFALQART